MTLAKWEKKERKHAEKVVITPKRDDIEDRRPAYRARCPAWLAGSSSMIVIEVICTRTDLRRRTSYSRLAP